jgi:hypothetical protein
MDEITFVKFTYKDEEKNTLFINVENKLYIEYLKKYLRDTYNDKYDYTFKLSNKLFKFNKSQIQDEEEDDDDTFFVTQILTDEFVNSITDEDGNYLKDNNGFNLFYCLNKIEHVPRNVMGGNRNNTI